MTYFHCSPPTPYLHPSPSVVVSVIPLLCLRVGPDIWLVVCLRWIVADPHIVVVLCCVPRLLVGGDDRSDK